MGIASLRTKQARQAAAKRPTEVRKLEKIVRHQATSLANMSRQVRHLSIVVAQVSALVERTFSAPGRRSAARPGKTLARGAALDEARARGAAFRAAIMDQPYMWTGEDVANRLGVSRQAIDKKRQSGELFALSWGSNRVLYPSWQVELEVFPHMKAVLGALQGADPWTVFRFFTTPEASGGDQTPLDMLRKGMATQVLEAARAFGERS
jgi:hypothetical protein